MGKEDKKSTPKPAPYVSKRQLTKFERERRLTLIALGACAVFVVIIVGVLGVGVWRELHRGDDPVATVQGHTITAETYAKVVGFRTAEIDIAIARYQAFLNSADAQNPDNDYLVQLSNQEMSSLSQQKMTLEESVVNYLIKYELIKTEAANRGLTATQEEVDQNIYARFGGFSDQATAEGTPTAATDAAAAPASGTPAAPAATATPAPTATATSTPTPGPTPTPEPTATPAGTATPYPTPTPASKEEMTQARKNLNDALTQMGGFMNENEYVELIAKPEILGPKLQEAMGKTAATSAEQVHVAHILLNTEQEAKDVLAQLQNGADFATLAKEKSTDNNTKENGGDLGWFTHGAMLAEFEDAAFKTKPGEIYPEVVSTAYGYHVIKGIEYDANRPLDAEQLSTAQAAVMNNWLNDQQSKPDAVKYNYGWDQVQWARSYVASYQKKAQENAIAAATKTATVLPKTTATPKPAAAAPGAAQPAPATTPAAQAPAPAPASTPAQ